jgi:hypothetical protein
MALHYKTKMALDILLHSSHGFSGSGGSEQFTYYTVPPEGDPHAPAQSIISIPAEAQQLLDAAVMLISKADIAIEQNRNLTY